MMSFLPRPRSHFSVPSISLLGGLVLLLVLTVGCGGSSGNTNGNAASNESAAGTPAEAAEQMQKFSEQMQQGQDQGQAVDPVNFRKLRALLPERLDSLERTSQEGQTQSAMGVKLSQANATYEGRGRSQIDVKITDIGALPGAAMMGYGWAVQEIDRESSNGYEKTTRYQGHKAHEKYERDSQSGQVQVLVTDRFVVEVNGDGLAMGAVKDALGRLDLSALEEMKNEGT